MSHVPFVSSYHKIPVDDCDLPPLHSQPSQQLQQQHCQSSEWSQLLCCCLRQLTYTACSVLYHYIANSRKFLFNPEGKIEVDLKPKCRPQLFFIASHKEDSVASN
uniref:Uncharacterized protein n=1 Tax=Syphacia muris TaxID=451379 RepID=A0A0N5AZZ3_9BILA